MFDKQNLAENKRHSLQERDVSDGGLVPNAIGHCSSLYSPGIPICNGEGRFLWKRH